MALRTLPSRLSRPAPRISRIETAGGVNASHYRTDGHKQWAAEVKRRDGYTCQKCGAHGQGVRLIADHIIEIMDGGAKLDPANGRTLCVPCHNKKTASARASRASEKVVSRV